MKFFALFAAFVTLASAQPVWYSNIKSNISSVYIGFGCSEIETLAKQAALNDIASQISVTIEGTVSQTTKDVNGQISRVSEDKILQNSKASMSDYKLLKSEFADGSYFVALSYENIPSLDKFVKKVQETNKSIGDEKQNSYLKNTPIAQELQKIISKNIDFSLQRKDKKWFLKYRDILQVLDTQDFGKLFVSVANTDLNITTSKKDNILRDGDKFYFKAQSAKSGFVSILTVYENGTVSTLIQNVPISKDVMRNIPDKESENIPEAGLVEKGIETFDLYIAIYSPKKLEFDSFAFADDTLISHEKYKNFDELIRFLDGKIFATLKVVTKPR